MSVPETVGVLHSIRSEATSEELVRKLIQSLPPIHSSRSDGGNENETETILMDLDLDGARYLLVRMPAVNPVKSQLSPREQEIVRMVAQGHANKIIAAVLGISTWTVCTHLRRIFAKLGVGSRAAMVAKLLGGSNGNPVKATAARESHHTAGNGNYGVHR